MRCMYLELIWDRELWDLTFTTIIINIIFQSTRHTLPPSGTQSCTVKQPQKPHSTDPPLFFTVQDDTQRQKHECQTNLLLSMSFVSPREAIIVLSPFIPELASRPSSACGGLPTSQFHRTGVNREKKHYHLSTEMTEPSWWACTGTSCWFILSTD